MQVSSCKRAPSIFRGRVQGWEGRWGSVPAPITLPLSSLLSSAMSPLSVGEKHWALDTSQQELCPRACETGNRWHTGCAGWCPLSSRGSPGILMTTHPPPHPGGSTASPTISWQVELLGSTSTEQQDGELQKPARPGQTTLNSTRFPRRGQLGTGNSFSGSLLWGPTP